LLPPESFTGSQKKCSPAKAPDGSVVSAAGRNSDENLSAQLVFVDLDAEIEAREGRSIREIFAEGGEAAFRAVERETLAELLYRSGVLPLREFASLTPPSADADGPPASVGVPGKREFSGVQPRVARPSGAIATSSGNPSAKLLISLGGGTLTDPESRELVRKHCRCIYLRASLETLAANLRWEGEAATRPMLAGADPNAPADSPDSLEARISAMMAERAPIYESAADVIIDIDGLSYEDAARLVLNSF
jgi:shikimate kinase